jgi:hypothetical protein
MQSVANVILNRAANRETDAYTECVKPLQFSSLTAHGDPELTLWPANGDASWTVALELSGLAAGGTLEDITGGADLYYAPAGQHWAKRFTWLDGSEVVFPDNWNADAVIPLCSIGGQLFFRTK